MERDLGDILDRGSIAKLKHERIRAEECTREWKAFEEEINRWVGRVNNLQDFFHLLYDINSQIWDRESDMRLGKLDGVLYEVGIRAIEIRKLNNLRVQVKNIVNKMAGCGFQDIKKDHLSEPI